MGMFDTIHDRKTKCPRCGASGEIQTKDLECMMEDYEVLYKEDEEFNKMCGHHRYARASSKLRFVNAIFSCNSSSCRALSRMQDYLKNGYVSGFGLSWDITYKVDADDDGLLIGPAKFDTDKPYSFDNKDYKEVYDEFVKKVNEDCKRDAKLNKQWEDAMAMGFNNPMMAVLYFHGESPERRVAEEKAREEYERKKHEGKNT